MKILKVLLIGYLFIVFLLFLYSFTQIDLSLTFSRIEFLRELVKSFQYIGYFNRLLSGSLYLMLLMGLYIFYFIFLSYATRKKLHKKYVWTLIVGAVTLLAFSYNAFSHDLFNYIFDAKIVTYYHENPYVKKALDYAGDPMLSYMHWTHRVYPYGPFWLLLTVPLSFIGFQLFLPTFFLFKLLMAASFIGSTYFVGKILEKIAPEKTLFGVVFFGLNPLLLIESLVSAHLDIVMIFFSLWAFYLLLQKKYSFAYALFLFSVGIKFATIFLLPVFLIIPFLQKNTLTQASQKEREKRWNMIFGLSLILLVLSVIAASLRSNFQPWYLVVALAFVPFVAHRYFVFIPSQIIAFAALLTYVPYLYLGNWDKPVPEILSNIYIASYVLSVLAVGMYFLLRKLPVILTQRRVTTSKG